MRRFLTLVCLLCLAIPAGISISGCTRNPDANYCNGLGYGLQITNVSAIFLQPQTTGISIAFGQTVQVSPPTAQNCKGAGATVTSYSYGTTNNQLVDISPTGTICAGTWNRNTGGGIANYTICNPPSPLPSTGGLPYLTAYITASAQSVTSNPVEVYVHPQVTSVTLVTEPTSGSAQQCFSQGQQAQLDAQACFLGSNNTQQVLCAPASITSSPNPVYACPGGVPPGVTSIPSCSAAIGALSYVVGTSSIASINSQTNQITAEQPGTTVITASVAQSGSSAGYFSTCPPASINVTLQNGLTKGTITQGVQQNLTTTVVDTQGNPITGLSLNYQSTDPTDISTASGAITASFPSQASLYAICQPPACNSSPINEVGLYGTGLSISSNPVSVTVPGTASEYLWFGAPGQSQYYVPVELLTGTIGSPLRLPYVPNSMLMDKLGQNLYFGSARELMIYSSTGNILQKQDTTVPGVVLAVSPNNAQLLINDQARQVFYLYNVSTGIQSTFGGVGNAAAWTPDAQTLYITDNANLGAGHSDTLYVYNQNTGWTTYPLQPSPLPAGALPPSSLPPNTFVPISMQTPAITIPSVGAFLRGSPTVAHTWCPTGIVGDSASILFYPQEDSVAAESDVLAATTDGNHILGASTAGGNITLSDIGVTIPQLNCLPPESSPNYPLAPGDALSPLVLATAISPATITADATAVTEVVPSPASNLAFVMYTGSTPGASLPYYVPGAPGTVGSVTLKGSAASSITAPVAGVFSPDGTLFFVSTSGDNLIHYISVPTLTDTQQIAPNLPACTPLADGGVDPGCTLTAPTTNPIPATVITVTTRSTT